MNFKAIKEFIFFLLNSIGNDLLRILTNFKISVRDALIGGVILLLMVGILGHRIWIWRQNVETAHIERTLTKLRIIVLDTVIPDLSSAQKYIPPNPFVQNASEMENFAGSFYWVSKENTPPGFWAMQYNPRWPALYYHCKNASFNSAVEIDGEDWLAFDLIPARSVEGQWVGWKLQSESSE